MAPGYARGVPGYAPCRWERRPRLAPRGRSSSLEESELEEEVAEDDDACSLCRACSWLGAGSGAAGALASVACLLGPVACSGAGGT